MEISFSQADSERPLETAKSNAQGALSVRVTIPADAATDKDARLHATAQKGADGNGLILNSAPLPVFPDTNDSDGDGVKDMCDNCPKLASSDMTDLDGDNLGDVCDPVPYRSGKRCRHAASAQTATPTRRFRCRTPRFLSARFPTVVMSRANP